MSNAKDVMEAGEAKERSRCEVCGNEGETVVVPFRDPPNRFCLRCAVEYGDTSDLED